MKLNEFINDENFLHNLGDEQIEEIFDMEAINELDNNQRIHQRVFWLSQWLIGNVSEPFKDIKKLDNAEQFRVFDTWFDLVKDADTLRLLGKSICSEFIQGKAL